MASNLPQHIAIIMDGNGRWAKRRGLPRTFGHRQGAKAVRRIINACLELNINYLTLYTFSTENWSRPKSEVKTLMGLLEEYIDRAEKEIPRYKEVRVRVIGRYWELPGQLPYKIEKLMDDTKAHKGLNLILAINYGGRREILDAVDKIVETGKKLFGDESRFRKYLYAPDIPDPDLLIRTAGEYRISNFLLWQISYTELYTTNKLWPDFNKRDLILAINDYRKRRRKFGGL
jgi:undecaprenyl diphosphate synthase